MKSLIQIIKENLVTNFNKALGDPTKKQNNKVNNIRKPTAQSRRHGAAPIPKTGGLKKSADGTLQSVNLTAKDRQAQHLKDCPTCNTHLSSATKKPINRIMAQKYLPQVNINNTIAKQKPKRWQVSNSQMTITYVPNVGRYLPDGSGKKEGIFYIN